MKNTIRCAVWSSRKFVPQMVLSLSEIKTARARSEKQIKSKFMKSKFHQVTHVRRQSVESEHTGLNGHIHQTMQKVEGNVTFHTACSTAFPQPKPGEAPSPGPMKVPAEQLRSVLGITDVNYIRGQHALAVVDSTLA